MAVVEFLLDTSVLTRIRAPGVSSRVDRLITAGTAAVCVIAVAEVLRGTRSREHHVETLAQLRAFPWLPTPDDVWDRVLEIQSAFADRGLHQSVKVPDLAIAAVAERNRLPLLHYDQDFDTIAEVTGQLCEWVVPRGSV